MKWIRHISLLLVFVLMFTSSAFATGIQKKQNTKYDGETLYRGIVFGQGPVAQLLPEYFNKQALEQASSEDAKKTVDFVIQKMKSINPGYFDEFSKVVYSGNRLAIDRQLAVGGEMLAHILKIKEADARIQANGPVTGDCVYLYVGYALAVVTAGGVFNYALAVNAAAVVNGYALAVVATAVYAKNYFWPKSAIAADNSIEKEKFINSIATNLR